MSDLNQTAGVFRDPTRPLHTKGGPPGYVEKSLAAAAEPFKGITTDGTVIPGLFSIQKTVCQRGPLKRPPKIFSARSARSSARKLSSRWIRSSGVDGVTSIPR